MKEKILTKFLLATFLILMTTTAMAAATVFSVDEPDGTADSTSGYYTMSWTPSLSFPLDDMFKDVNTISCFADNDNSGYEQAYTITTGQPCCDSNNLRFDVFGWTGRLKASGTDYYIWCMSDQNTDLNAYSGGALTISGYDAGNIGPIAIDTVGAIMNALAENIGAVAAILIVIIVVVILVDLITGIFGIVAKIRDTMGNR